MEDLRPVGGMGPRAQGKVKGSFGGRKDTSHPGIRKKEREGMIRQSVIRSSEELIYKGQWILLHHDCPDSSNVSGEGLSFMC